MLLILSFSVCYLKQVLFASALCLYTNLLMCHTVFRAKRVLGTPIAALIIVFTILTFDLNRFIIVFARCPGDRCLLCDLLLYNVVFVISIYFYLRFNWYSLISESISFARTMNYFNYLNIKNLLFLLEKDCT